MHSRNEHDSKTFPSPYNKIKIWNPAYVVVDAAYKASTIAKTMIDEGLTTVFPYTRPHTKNGLFRKNEYIYDEYYGCYICPNNEILIYSSTTRDEGNTKVIEASVQNVLIFPCAQPDLIHQRL